MLELLVVDDEKDICWALEMGLVDDGVHITQAHRGEDAIQAVRGRSFDVAIIDVKLPGTSGLEVSHTIRQLAPRLPIVMISGYHYGADPPIQEGIQRGAYQGFISKPFELDQVAALLRRVVKEGLESPSAPHPTLSPSGGEEQGEGE